MRKVIAGASDYEVTSQGQIISHKGKSERQLSLKPGKDKYVSCTLVYDDGRTLTKLVHRLVAEAFISNFLGKLEVNHIDSDRSNNKVSNLEWVSSRENTLHAYKYGSAVSPSVWSGKFGIDHTSSKEVHQYDIDGNYLESFGSCSEAARVTGGDQGTISRACTTLTKVGNRRKCVGCYWAYDKINKLF